MLRNSLPDSVQIHNCILLSLMQDGVERHFYVNSDWNQEHLLFICLDRSEPELDKIMMFTQSICQR